MATPKLDCDALDLLDEAYALSLAVTFEKAKALTLIENLRHCANEAREGGMAALEHKMRHAADELQQRCNRTSDYPG